MKNTIFCFLLSLVCSVCFAQSSFSLYLMNGDVKMKESFYDMALSYYRKALSEATTPEDVSTAEQRIRECKRAMTPPGETRSTSKTKRIFTDQYLETGEIYDKLSDEGPSSSKEEDYPLSLYQIEVFRNSLIIVSHVDQEDLQELDDLPAGTVLPLVEETESYRRFSSGKEGEHFIVLKEVMSNSYGRYRIIFREQNNQFYILYPTALIKSMINTTGTGESEARPTEENASEVSGEVYPVRFTDAWVLNLDEEGERIGDSRTAPLRAKDIYRLMIRFRYSCPDSFKDKLRFDFKLLDPSGALVLFSGRGTKTGYSATEELETIPGGGIFNIVVKAGSPGSFRKGTYTLSLWCNNIEYYSVVIELE